jgi:parvulin-like peptidyl-prolyl isomerase
MLRPNTSNRLWFMCLGWLVGILIQAAVPLHAQPESKMVALVNGSVISQNDLDDALMRYYHPTGNLPEDATAAPAPADSQEVRLQLLENLIDRELLLQEAQRRGLTVSTARIQRRIQRLPEGLRPKAAAEDAAGANAGAEDALFHYVHTGLLIERLLGKALPQIGAVSERSARAYYKENAARFIHPEEVHLRHILVKVSPKMTVAERQQAYLQIQAIEQRLAEGGNFTALAIDASQCPSKNRGGDLGYLTRDQLYPSLAEAAFALKPGDRSRIVESPAGYHLLLVTDRRPARQLSFLLVREGLQKQLRAERQHKAARSFIRRLREIANIERFLQ